ncbi:unnamed protein product, partial [Polarella glacialis]
LTFDICLLALDMLTAVSQYDTDVNQDTGAIKSVRSFRILRAMRLLRLMKLSRLSAVIEEASAANDRQWLVLVVAIVKTTFAMLVVAHCLAC